MVVANKQSTTTLMLIPIRLTLPSASGHPLPPQLVKITGSEDVAIVELQGSLDVDGDQADVVVGTLRLDDNVRHAPLVSLLHSPWSRSRPYS